MRSEFLPKEDLRLAGYSSQIDYWDSVAQEKRFSHPLRAGWLSRYLKAGATILDVGCGYGRTLNELSQSGFKNVVGLDYSAAMLERANVEVPGANLVRNDGHSLPFKANSFDAILCFAVFTCIPHSNEQRSLVAEVQRVLRPGGLIYISDLLVNTDERNRNRYESNLQAFGCYGVFALPEGVVVRHHTKEWIEDLTGSFQLLEFEPFTVTTMNGNQSAAFQYLGQKTGTTGSR